MKFKFEQYNIEINDPIVSAKEDTIRLKVSKSTISVFVTLETESSQFGVVLEDISVSNLNYEGYDNLMLRVNDRLKDFAV
jgi:hypothetical protein